MRLHPEKGKRYDLLKTGRLKNRESGGVNGIGESDYSDASKGTV
jgi:hypothetical protein